MTLASDFLERMEATRHADLRREFGEVAPADRERLACCARPPRDFLAALTEGLAVAVIAEVKKASPTRGPIAPTLEASRQARVYEYGGASAVSVLTEPSAFGGTFHDLSDVADAVGIPVLCKDFVVDPLQLFVARGHGADAALLMVSMLGERLGEYLDLAHSLGMTALVEVHDMAELDVASEAHARLVGVNSRDLRTLKVDVPGARALVTEAKSRGHAVVAESGLKTRDDVKAAAAAGADAVLVGEALMDALFPEDVLEELTGVARSAPVSE